jgi:DNA mismatch endonuclease, patch repair protein
MKRRSSKGSRAHKKPYAPSDALQSKARDGFVLEVDEATSVRMAGIRQRGTKPELVVRKLVTALRARYRVENRDLPGSPDLANRSRAWAIFVHGCYWHRHPGCKRATTPKRNRPFWEAKFRRNIERDREALDELHAHGFTCLVVWECETEDFEHLLATLSRWPPLSR